MYHPASATSRPVDGPQTAENQRYDIEYPEGTFDAPEALLGPSGGISSCSHCGADLGYEYPATRYLAVYCSMSCHQAALADGLDEYQLLQAVTS